MVVAAEDQVDARDAARERAVVGDVVVSEPDDQLGTLLLQALDRRRGAGDGRRECDIGAGRRQDVGLRRENAEKPDLVDGHVDQVEIDRTNRRLAVGPEDVGAEPGKVGFCDPRLGDLGAEVELVITEDRDVGPEQVVQLDHLPALGEAGEHRR
jgi:hypothetical protein